MKLFAILGLTIGLSLATSASQEEGTDSSVHSICDRTPQVRDSILRAIGETDRWTAGFFGRHYRYLTCDEVTERDLLGVYELNLSGQGISEFRADDFEGLVNLERLDFSGSIKLREKYDCKLTPENKVECRLVEGLVNLERLDFSGSIELREKYDCKLTPENKVECRLVE